MSDDIDSKEILEQKFPIITIEDEMRDSYLEYAMSVIAVSYTHLTLPTILRV